MFALWLRRVGVWGLEWRYFSYGLLLPVGSLILFHLLQSDAKTVSVVGMILQLSAIGTVWYDIQDKMRQFGKKSVLQVWSDRLCRFPALRVKPIRGSIECEMERMKFRGGLKMPITHECDSLVEKVNHIQQQLDYVLKEFNDARHQLNKELVDVKQEVAANQHTLARVDQDLRELVDKTATDGLHVSGMGAFWLFCGVIFSSIPESIAHIYQ